MTVIIPIESTNESALPPNVAKVTTPLVYSIASAQDHFGDDFHLHFLNELLSHPSSNSIYSTTQTDVLFSQKVKSQILEGGKQNNLFMH